MKDSIWTTDAGVTWNASVNGTAVNTTVNVPNAAVYYTGFQINISAASARHMYWRYFEAKSI